MFDLSASKTSSERTASWLPTVVGIAATICIAWLLRPRPAPDSLSLPGLAVLSIGYVVLCALLGTAAMWATTAFLDPAASRTVNLRTCAAMVWLAPLTLFLFHKSLWAFLAAMLVGWLLAKAIQPTDSSEPDNPYNTTGLFQTIRIMDAIPHVPSLVALSAVVCLYGGISALLVNRPLTSAAFLGTASVLLASSSNRFRLHRDHRPIRTFTKPASLLLTFAILFTAAGLLRYLHLGSGSEDAPDNAVAEQPDKSKGLVDGDYLGVILLTEPRPNKVLIPPRAILKRELFSATQAEPLSIPFVGVYWMFRWPNTQPPAGSYTVTKTPLDQNFYVTDRRPLKMEARQNFGSPIDLSCCSQIQLVIRSADGPTSLELIVSDTTQPKRRSLSLGYGRVPSTFVGRVPTAAPVPMTMTFNVPANPTLEQFDEATIVFNGSYARAAAKVAIDRFIFVPRIR